MQTHLADWIKDTPQGVEADAILRKCVHCGFCLATCPTYNLLGDELDSPRGRIYLMKQMLEGAPVTQRTQLHLDRCLTCRACETTCPSGVEFGRLVDIGRDLVETKVPRSPTQRMRRWFLKTFLPSRGVFGAALALGRLFKPVLPTSMARRIPERRAPGAVPAVAQAHSVAFHSPCSLQHGLKITGAVESILREAGYSLTPVPDSHLCCGSAGTYSILKPGISKRLLKDKVRALESGFPETIATANIGCLAHLESGTDVPVRHWIELLEEALEAAAPPRGDRG